MIKNNKDPEWLAYKLRIKENTIWRWLLGAGIPEQRLQKEIFEELDISYHNIELLVGQ